MLFIFSDSIFEDFFKSTIKKRFWEVYVYILHYFSHFKSTVPPSSSSYFYTPKSIQCKHFKNPTKSEFSQSTFCWRHIINTHYTHKKYSVKTWDNQQLWITTTNHAALCQLFCTCKLVLYCFFPLYFYYYISQNMYVSIYNSNLWLEI